MSDAVRQRILEENEGMAKQALRCLAIAVKTEDLRELESYDGTRAEYDIASLYMVSFCCFVTEACGLMCRRL